MGGFIDILIVFHFPFSLQLDYIPRLMWQAQLRGQKHWMLAPTPECEAQCSSFSFFVEAGDASKGIGIFLD